MASQPISYSGGGLGPPPAKMPRTLSAGAGGGSMGSLPPPSMPPPPLPSTRQSVFSDGRAYSSQSHNVRMMRPPANAPSDASSTAGGGAGGGGSSQPPSQHHQPSAPPKPPSPHKFNPEVTQEFNKKIEHFHFPFCDDINKKYTRVKCIGKGTFGEVHMAKVNMSAVEEHVAMKKIIMEKETEGFPITALREIKILKSLNHPNIVKLKEVCRQPVNLQKVYQNHLPEIYLIFEFCHHDLAGLLSSSQQGLTDPQIKGILKQLFDGLHYLHLCKILHRDMKSANIFISKSGVLKIGDFGLARAYTVARDNRPNKYTNRVVTMWYRPPELLLGERNYTSAIDVWGAGCIMAELFTRKPLLQGNSETDQLNRIAKLCGSILPSVWPNVEKLELYKSMRLPTNFTRRLQVHMNQLVRCQQGLNLLDRLLTLDPSQRITAKEASEHTYLSTHPPREENLLSLVRNRESCFEATSRRHIDNRGNGNGTIQGIRPQSSRPVPPSNSMVHDRIY